MSEPQSLRLLRRELRRARAMALLLAFAVALSGVSLVAAVPEGSEGGPAILQRRCVQCHGPATQMGDLDLSSRESALQGGTRGAAMSPSDPDGSLMLARVLAGEMPPGAPLPTDDKQALREWIAAGAEWSVPLHDRRAGPDWWAFQPLAAIAPPPLESAAPGWSSSPIDRWILDGLESAGLSPAPEAGRRDWIRRVSYTLTGLPPTPAEIDSFVADRSPQAHERVVDRLLASPHYGERWARHWLDLVRFAESEGFERDLPRDHVWPYRDYLVRSFNEDKSYLRFAREQIAGDVMEKPTRASVVATTMLTLGPVDAVGLTSAIPEERALIREDMLEEMLGTVTQSFLGLTVNCARCHDHKFDPITQEEYYRMKAAFEGVWPPTRPVPSAGLDALFPHGRPILTPTEERSRNRLIADLENGIERVSAALGRIYRNARPSVLAEGQPQPYARWSFDTDGRADYAPLHLRFVRDAEVSGGTLGARSLAQPAETVEREEEDPGGGEGFAVSRLLDQQIGAKTLEAWIEVVSVPEKSLTLMEIRGLSGFRGASVDGIRYEAGDDPRWENVSVGRFRSQNTGGPAEDLQPGTCVHVAVTYAKDGTIAIYRNGEAYGAGYRPDSGIPAGRLQIYPSGDALVRFTASEHLRMAEARLYDRALSASEIAASHRSGIVDLTPAMLFDHLSLADQREVKRLGAERTALQRRLDAVPEPELVHAATIRAAAPTHVLMRGSVSSPGKQVLPGGLSCIDGHPGDLGLQASSSEGPWRRAMAEWIASAQNPLFSRVIVNRVWQAHFGRGFVSNPSDFGYNGGLPSHPGLLDQLASDLIRQGWSLKSLHRSILTSQVYRQSSRHDQSAASKDADNRLLWSFPHQRLDAEAVRDSMLAVSGELNRALYGMSFRPFEFGEKRGSLRHYVLTQSDTPDTRRRTLYRMNVITATDPLLEALDCPLPSVKTPRRRSTTTPLQSLSLMNSAFVQQRAAGFAARVRKEATGVEAQVSRAFELAFGRRPDQREMDDSRSLVERHGLESLCWGLFNTSEFLYVR